MAFDKDNRQVLGNIYGQGFLVSNNYKQSLHYKNLKQLAGSRIKVYKIYRIKNYINTGVHALIETVHIEKRTKVA